MERHLVLQGCSKEAIDTEDRGLKLQMPRDSHFRNVTLLKVGGDSGDPLYCTVLAVVT
jgi:hypothetical protein